jgi:hypothetical protein
MWAYPFSKSWAFDGYSASEAAGEYREIYDLTAYLLTNYNRSGKTFYLGHWEGDWYLLPNYNAATNPRPTAIQGMIHWLNHRQKAIDDAKLHTPHRNVDVYGYAEVNRVVDATSSDTNINRRMINTVIPAITNLDFLSWSAYDIQDASTPTLHSALDYLKSMIPPGKANSISGERIWIGEYGWGIHDAAAQEQRSRAFIQRLLGWSSGPRFILFWEIYNNEPHRGFWLVDSNHVRLPAYELHKRFIQQARTRVAQFRERNGRLPRDAEFASLVSPLLGHPLPPPDPLALSDLHTKPLTATAVSVIGTLAQQGYGDDPARVWLVWGKQDAGTNRSLWENQRFLGVNTNFNPVRFSADVSNLPAQVNFSFRLYATNCNGETWSPAPATFRAGAH